MRERYSARSLVRCLWGILTPDPVCKRVKNFLQDLLRGPDVDRINLAGIDTVVVVGLGKIRYHYNPSVTTEEGLGILAGYSVAVSGLPHS